MQTLSEYLPKDMCDNTRDELHRNVELAKHFMHVMVETGFAARHVAIAFIASGIDLAEEVGGKYPTLDLLHVMAHLVEEQKIA